MSTWQIVALAILLALVVGFAAFLVWLRRSAMSPADAGAQLRALGVDLVRLPGRLRRVAALVAAEVVPVLQLGTGRAVGVWLAQRDAYQAAVTAQGATRCRPCRTSPPRSRRATKRRRSRWSVPAGGRPGPPVGA